MGFPAVFAAQMLAAIPAELGGRMRLIMMLALAPVPTVHCEHHNKQAEYTETQAGLDVYCHAEGSYVGGVHCYGLLPK